MHVYWAYVNSNYEWNAWYYVNSICEIKLGPFNTRNEAKEAVEKYENYDF